jgi:hypothetical protein
MLEAEKIIPNARHEPTDIGEGFIWGAVASCLGVLVGLALLVLWLYPQSSVDRTLSLPLPVYPAPRLQPSPPADMQQFYSEEMHFLNSSGWVDQAQGVAHIPISDAMREVAQEGIPQWPTSPEPAP